MSKDFSYTLEKHIATLSESDNGDFTTELNIIIYNGASPKIDIRKWDRRTDKMLKGIALTESEAQALKEALAKAI